jgi:hypothetical protein
MGRSRCSPHLTIRESGNSIRKGFSEEIVDDINGCIL